MLLVALSIDNYLYLVYFSLFNYGGLSVVLLNLIIMMMMMTMMMVIMICDCLNVNALDARQLNGRPHIMSCRGRFYSWAVM